MRINNEYWRAILSATKVSPDTGSAEKRSESLQNLVPGQQVKGEVLARISDQVYLVKIAGDVYRTELPGQTQPGTKLTLTFRTSEPRPEFSLQNDRSDMTTVRLSPTTTQLTEALKAAANQPPVQTAKSLNPLLTTPLANTSTLAASLQNALSLSGHFYESHLLQWFLGERLFADIQKESRLRLASLSRDSKASAGAEGVSEFPDLAVEEKGFLSLALAEDDLPDMQKHFAALPELLTSSQLREQIETLLTGIFHWKGSVWQNQEMAWEVEKNDPENTSDSERSWRTTIRLSLPNLGDVSATLISSAEGITGRITTDSTESKKIMQQELTILEERMAGSGLSLRSMTIGQHDEE